MFTNPVYDGYFADPFVLRYDGAFYAYGTGAVIDGRVFEVLTSLDLVHWRSLGGALQPFPGGEGLDYWAPEVAVDGGRLWMYYSAGRGDAGHRPRVATADRPEGPFVDCGVVLTPDEPFAIDASPFRDVDGSWYLYYARDVLDGERPGTALAVDRLDGMTALAGDCRTVLRASADWQRYARDRSIYGAVYDWHTLEGPHVRRHDGRYYCFFSGGAWHGPDYGVSYCVADSPLGPFTEAAGPEPGPALLRTRPGQVLGPGHSSLVQTPVGEDFLVYHAWDAALTARRMCIDRVVWTPDGPRVRGPSTTPQAAPNVLGAHP